MISKLNKFIESLREPKKYNKYYLYSQIIKNERAKRKLTLAEIAKGICSVSYLCKFEKNDIIADESYIRAIFEKVNLDFNLVGRNILKDGIENSLRAYLANDYEKIELLYISIDDSIFNAQNYLIKCFYYLVNKKYKELNETIKAIDNIKDTLLIDDVGVFFFLVVQYYIDTLQYYEANKILRASEGLKFNVVELKWLIDEQNFKVGFHLEDYHQMYCYYYKIVNTNSIGYPGIRKIFLRAKYLYALASSNFQRTFTEFNELNYFNVPKNYHLDLDFWKIAAFIKGGMYLKAFDLIYDNGLYIDARFLALLLLSAYKIGDENYINLACEVANNHEVDIEDQHHNLFIKFMLLYLKGKYKHEYIEYLKEKILPYRKKYIHFIYHPFYLDKYIYYLKKGSRYKEAFTLLHERQTNLV